MANTLHQKMSDTATMLIIMVEVTMVGVIRNIPIKLDIVGCRTTPYIPVVTNSTLLLGFLVIKRTIYNPLIPNYVSYLFLRRAKGCLIPYKVSLSKAPNDLTSNTKNTALTPTYIHKA